MKNFTFSKYCTPAYLNLTLGVAILIGTFLAGLRAETLFIEAAFIVIWAFGLNWLCSKGFKIISWSLAVVPIILAVYMVILVKDVVAIKEGETNQTPELASPVDFAVPPAAVAVAPATAFADRRKKLPALAGGPMLTGGPMRVTRQMLLGGPMLDAPAAPSAPSAPAAPSAPSAPAGGPMLAGGPMRVTRQMLLGGPMLDAPAAPAVAPASSTDDLARADAARKRADADAIIRSYDLKRAAEIARAEANAAIARADAAAAAAAAGPA